MLQVILAREEQGLGLGHRVGAGIQGYEGDIGTRCIYLDKASSSRQPGFMEVELVDCILRILLAGQLGAH